jgi:hypothetical protein
MRKAMLVALAAVIVGVGGALLLPGSRNASRRIDVARSERTAATAKFAAPAQGLATRKPSPPALRSAGRHPGAVVINPTAPDYDPVHAAAALGGTRNLFPREPRDPAWAVPVEAALTPMISDDLTRAVPGVSDVKVECRTTMCRISWKGPHDQQNLARQVLSTMYSGAIESFPGINDILITYAGGPFFSSFKGRPTELIAKFTSDRAARLQELRSGQAPRHIAGKLPPALWK